MRVLAVTAWYPSDDQPHLGAYVLEHVLAASAHCQIDLIHPTVERSLLHPGRTVASEQIAPGCRLHRLGLRLMVRRFGHQQRRLRAEMYRLVRALAASGPTFDLIHVHVLDHNTRIMADIAHRLGIPMVHSEHWSFYHRGFAALPPPERARTRARVKAWLGNPNLRFILPVSQDLGGHLVRTFGAPAERVVVVPNIAGEAFQYAEKDDAGETFNIVLAASWHAPKNPVLFVKALTRLPPDTLARIRIDWIGDGPELTPCKDIVAAELPHLRVRFHGYRDKAFVADCMRRAHLLVHPTDAENLPTVIVESLCCGTPVLSHEVNGVPELIDGHNGVMCPPGDVEAFTDALDSILKAEHPFDHERIAREADALYRPAVVGRTLAGLYRRAVEEGS